MSGFDIPEPMEVDNNDDMNQTSAQSDIQQRPTAADKPAADEDEALGLLSLKWINPDEPQKMKRPQSCLEKMLQSWFNKCKLKVDCTVKKILTDRRVVIKVKPGLAITELQRLIKQTLTGKDGSSVTVTSVSLTLPPPGFDTQMPADASMNLPPFQPQTVQVQPQKQRNAASADGEESGTSSKSETQTEQDQPGQQSNRASAAGERHSCSVPVGLFWYVTHLFMEELKRIEKVNGVQISAEVKVKFEVEQKDGSPDKALDEFTNLMQTHMTEFSGSVIPLKFIDPDQWRDALKTIQKKENKLLVTLTSKGMTACGPKYSQDVIRKLFNTDAHHERKQSASFEENEREIEDTSLKINLTSKDRFPDEGLIMEENYWKLMFPSYNEQVKRIKNKFNVELKDSNISQGKVSVKAFYKKGGGNASMESHALKALLRLYQKIHSSPMNFSQFLGASRSPMNTNNAHQSGGASNGPVLNGQSANRKHNTDAPHGGGATACSVRLTSVSLPSSQLGTQTPADASMNLPPFLPQTVQVQPEKQSNAASAAGEMLSCSVPVGLFWYVNHMYEEELKRIEKVNRVQIREEVKVKFEVKQKDGSPDKALNDFASLIQTRMTESSSSVIPLKFIDPDQWRDALKTIQKKENKLLVTLTSKGMSACGPKYSQDVISKTLFGDPVQHTNSNASLHDYQRELTQAHWRPPQSANRKHDAPHGGGATAGDSEEEKCPICLDAFKNKKRLECKHEFCEECLQQAKDANGPTCPVCRVVFGKIIGDQPDGNMSHRILHLSLPGFPHCNTILINYEIPGGIQTERHPNPGLHFSAISRNAYLPDNTEGNEVLQLLKKAFDQRLIFTIGTSRTTGFNGQVTWNDIHHKTSTTGGPQSFGYPDPEYLSRVKEELKAKGIE